jgi:membrane fusion protein, multidrug efflux system
MTASFEVDRVPAPPTRRKWIMALRALVQLGLVAAVAGGAVFGYQRLVATRPQVEQRAPAPFSRPVDVVTIRKQSLQPTLTLSGLVVAQRSADLRTLVAGEVTSISNDLVDGGAVKAGAELLALDPFTYEGNLVRARADLAEAEARIGVIAAQIEAETVAAERAKEQLDLAQRDRKRFDDLAKQDVASNAQLDQSRQRLSTARAALEGRQGQLQILTAQRAREQATLPRLQFAIAAAERDLQNTKLLAPFDAVVSNVAVDLGRLANTNDRVATLIDPNRLEVRFTLSDAQFGRPMADGRPLEGRSAIVFWRPGTFVDVLVGDREFAGVVKLPQSALYTGDIVYVLGDGNKIEPIEIRVVGYDGDDALVTGAVADGARVVTTRLAEAGRGLVVEPREVTANAAGASQ